jgi:hypothetical protein
LELDGLKMFSPFPFLEQGHHFLSSYQSHTMCTKIYYFTNRNVNFRKDVATEINYRIVRLIAVKKINRI